MTMPRLLALLLALLVAAPAFAQDAITPGHADLDMSRIVAGEAVYSVSIKQGPMEQTIGTLTAHLSIDQEAARIESIGELEMMGQKFADTTVAAWPSLASISHVSNNPQQSLRFSVSDGLIAGMQGPPGSELAPFEMSVDGPFLDAAWLRVVIAALPLADGYTTTVAAYDYDLGGIVDYTVSAEGPVVLELINGRKYDALKVEVTVPNDEPVTYFFDASTGLLLRTTFAPQPGLQVFVDAETGEGK